MNKTLFSFFILTLAFFSCTDSKLESKKTEGSSTTLDSVAPSEVIISTVDTVENIDTNELLNYRWIALKYLIDGDTVYSDKPFSLEFSESAEGKTYVVNKSKNDKKAWGFSKGILTLQVEESEKYVIVQIDSVHLTTKDVSPKGNTYYFLRSN